MQASRYFDLKAIYSRSLKSAQSLPVGANMALYSEDSGVGKGFTDLLERPDIQACIVACV